MEKDGQTCGKVQLNIAMTRRIVQTHTLNVARNNCLLHC